jgi:RHS repeat-associated protein
MITDKDGAIQARYHYSPYGELLTERSSGTDVSKYKYTAQELDDTTGLYYYNARFYDPAIGRFISADSMVPDPTGTQAFNRYMYTNGNPICYNDPSGHDPNSWDWPEYPLDHGGDPGSDSGDGGSGRPPDYYSNNTPYVFPEQKNNSNIKVEQPDTTAQQKTAEELRGGENNIVSSGENNNPIDNIQKNETYSLLFNGKELKILKGNKKIYSIPATSGKDEYLNKPEAQNIKNMGPIPEGTYYFYNNQWKSQNKVRQLYNIIRGNGDWGDYNVPLIFFGLQTRSNFYLHGGFFEGSAGCIDAGSNIVFIYNILKDQHFTYLQVEY